MSDRSGLAGIGLNPLKRVKFISIAFDEVSNLVKVGLNPLKRVKFISING